MYSAAAATAAAAASRIYGWLWIFSSSSVFLLLQTVPPFCLDQKSILDHPLTIKASSHLSSQQFSTDTVTSRADHSPTHDVEPAIHFLCRCSGDTLCCRVEASKEARPLGAAGGPAVPRSKHNMSSDDQATITAARPDGINRPSDSRVRAQRSGVRGWPLSAAACRALCCFRGARLQLADLFSCRRPY